MRVSVEWLREHVEIDDPIDALVERLPGIGFPVEHVERVGEDTVLEIELTANRPDCMSIVGMAREIGLLLGRPLRAPVWTLTERGAFSSQRIAVEIGDPEGCPRFTARVIEGVRVGPSPACVQRRLDASGIRAINNVVDITNYVMLELGQPMHAFDYDRVAGHRVVVRRARPGETLVTLDGLDRVLDEEMLVVADTQRAISLAGIIGGRETEIGPETTTVLLEAAYWHPPVIGRTARRLGVRTEASARFERGMDPTAPPRAQARAAALVAEWCGGRVLRGVVDVYPRPLAPRAIRLRPERAAAVLGVEIPRPEMIHILQALGCEVTEGAAMQVRAPSFRPDLTREEDLIEELIRIHGYERVPLTLPRGESTPGTVAPALLADRLIREALTKSRLTEVRTLTLVPSEAAAGGGASAVMLQNPLVADQTALRTSLLPGLLEVLATNVARGRLEDIQIYELGRVFRPSGADLRPAEPRSLGIAMMGRWQSGWNVSADQTTVDFFSLKGVLGALLRDLGIKEWEVATPPSPEGWWHPRRVADLVLAGRRVGRFGELHPDLAGARRLPHRAYLAEVDVESLLPTAVFTRAYAGLPRYPAVERDLALVSADALPAARIETIIREAAGPMLEDLELFDVYTGPPVPPGHRSLAYRLRVRAPDRTLTADEAQEIMARIRIALQRETGMQLRE